MTLLLQDTLVISPKTKQQVDKNTADIAELQEKAAIAYHFKGSKPTFNDLPTTGNEVGDVWDVQDTGANYGWTGTEWDELGPIADLEPYLTKEEAATIYSTKTETDALLASKQDTLTESQLAAVNSGITSDSLQTLETDVTNNKSEIADLKVSKQDTLTAGDSITIEDNVISVTDEKANKSEVYRSLSNEQKNILQTTGLYENQQVKSGEIFTAENGTFVQYLTSEESGGLVRTIKQLSYSTEQINQLLNQAYVTKSWTLPLPLANWVENKQTFTIQGLTADSSVDLNPVVPTTREEMIKLSNAGLFISALGENSITIECMNLPTEDLTVKLKREMTTNLILEEINIQLTEINGV